MKISVKAVISCMVILTAINVIPFKTGPQVMVSCGMEHRINTLTVLGLPFGYLQNSTHTGCATTLIKQSSSVFKVNDQSSVAYDNYYLKASALISDMVIGLALLSIAYIIVRQLQKMSRN